MRRRGWSQVHSIFRGRPEWNIDASRFNEARSWLAQAEALKFDSFGLRIQRLRLAFIEGYRGALDRIFDGEANGPNRVVFLRKRSEFEAQPGHLDSATGLQLPASKLSSAPEDLSWALVFFRLFTMLKRAT
jgi:hypothetical protein